MAQIKVLISLMSEYPGEVNLSVLKLSEKGTVLVGNSGSQPRSKAGETARLLADRMDSSQAHVTLKPAVSKK